MKVVKSGQVSDVVVRVTKEMIINAQTEELLSIAEEMRQNPEESLDSILKRRPPWKGWIDENGKVRQSPR